MRVLVTGAGSGIGAATARLFGERRALVICLDRDRDAVRAIRSEIEARGGSALDVHADIADSMQVQSARSAIYRTIGPIEVLVNNAGVNISGSVADLSDASWRAALDVNLNVMLRAAP
ncbi:MAG: SDR family NAD(P)-dependent oxidoreductase [Steroidobacteraceae bacterium]